MKEKKKVHEEAGPALFCCRASKWPQLTRQTIFIELREIGIELTPERIEEIEEGRLFLSPEQFSAFCRVLGEEEDYVTQEAIRLDELKKRKRNR